MPQELVTSGDLDAMCPDLPTHLLDPLASAFCEMLPAAGINTARRLPEFMGQVTHESGLQPRSENFNYSASRIVAVFGVGKHSAKVTAKEAKGLANKPALLADRVYGPGNPKKAAEFGNLEKGDGWKYRGRGLIQLTGKKNYAHYGALIGVDLVADPDLANDPRNAVALAIAYWNERHLNALADDGRTDEISRRVNGGDNGLAARRLQVAHARKIWTEVRLLNGPSPAAATPSRPSPLLVRAVQGKLAELRYYSGDADGIYGKMTRQAIMAFQDDVKLPVDGKVSDALVEALDGAQARRFSEKREEASVKTLAAADAVVDQAAGGKKLVLGGAAALVAKVTGGSLSDAASTAQDGLEKAQKARELAEGYWGLLGADIQAVVVSHWYVPVIAVGLGYAWHRFEKIQAARVAAVQEGK